jgi:hypothetical protein
LALLRWLRQAAAQQRLDTSSDFRSRRPKQGHAQKNFEAAFVACC